MSWIPDHHPTRTTIIGRTIVIVVLELTIALIHALRVGTYFEGALYRLYYSYFSDIAIPFGAYFLLSLNDISLVPFRDWRLKAGLAFGVASLAEILQGFGVPVLGETFDPADFVMFGVGVLGAVLVDKVLLDRALTFWSVEDTSRLG